MKDLGSFSVFPSYNLLLDEFLNLMLFFCLGENGYNTVGHILLGGCEDQMR